MTYNLLTCEGFIEGVKTSAIDLVGTECIKARLGLVILFFVIAGIRKWGGEEIGLDFSFLFGILGSLVSYFLIITFTGSFKASLIAGIGLGVLFGYGTGFLTGGGEY